MSDDTKTLADALLNSVATDTGSEIPEEIAVVAIRELADAIERRALND